MNTKDEKKAKRDRGAGMIYQPEWKDPKTGEYKQSPTWWIQYHYHGRKIRESSKSPNRADAVKLLNKRMGEMGKGQLIGPDAEKVLFEHLVTLLENDYKVNTLKSLDRAQDAIEHLRGAFGLDRAVDITTDRIDSYIILRQGAEGAKPATIHYELAVLKRMFSLAIEKGKLTQKPHITRIEVHNTRTGFFEESEFRAVQNHLPEDLQPVAEFAYLTGWRKQEILTLQWWQVDFVAGTVRLEPGSTKNDEGRTFPFNSYPPLKALLESQRGRTDAVQQARGIIVPWVFHRNGKAILDYRKAWKDACAAAGVPGRIPHDFRRTAVRNLERAGVPRSVAMKLTGHKTESVYRRYAIVSESDLSEGDAKLAALHQATGQNVNSSRVVVFPEKALDKVRTK
ncbi:MAG TPA: site-specific integrase [Acidobacteriota bacterium]|nr:site-specific integrase [Acidobacteriota bacterium]